jgi:hypothetical protein
MSKTQNNELERKLQGRTLRVYMYLQRKKAPSGIREVQRDLGLSSPSVADYQIEKLVELGLAARDEYGRVFVTRHVRVKALESYVSVGQFLVPRLAFYATIFTAVTVFYLITSLGSANIYGVIVPAAAAGIFWFEAMKMWNVQLGDKTPVAKEARDNRDFWVSLVPGMIALAVFIAAAFFLFYHVEPSRTEPESFPVDPDRVPLQGSASPITPSEVRVIDTQESQSNHSDIVANFPTSIITGFLFAGAIVAGFLVYLLVKYRCREGVLTIEQEQL